MHTLWAEYAVLYPRDRCFDVMSRATLNRHETQHNSQPRSHNRPLFVAATQQLAHGACACLRARVRVRKNTPEVIKTAPCAGPFPHRRGVAQNAALEKWLLPTNVLLRHGVLGEGGGGLRQLGIAGAYGDVDGPSGRPHLPMAHAYMRMRSVYGRHAHAHERNREARRWYVHTVFNGMTHMRM